MKTTKKVLAFVLALVMVFAVSAAAFAEDPNYDTSVTVTGVEQGNTLKLYRIAEASVGTDNVIHYTMASGLPAAYDTVDEIAAVTDADAKKAMANAFAEAFYGKEAAYSATAGSDKKAAVSTVAPGYYFAIVSGDADAGVIYQSMLINAVMQVDGNTYKAHDPITVAVKSETITITKTENKAADDDTQVDATDSYNLGSDISFTISTKIPNYPSNAKHAEFVIKDTPNGLEDALSTVKVTVDGTETAAGAETFSVEASGKGFVVTFTTGFAKSHAGQSVVVTYKGKLTGEVSTAGKTSNTAQVTFNPNPFDSGTDSIEDTDTQQIYGLVFEKVGQDDKALENAEFALLDADGNAVKDKDGNAMTCTTKKVTIAGEEHTYVWFEGLAAGTYTIKETKAPAGYTLAADTPMTVGETVSTADNPATTQRTESYYSVAENTVKNTKGHELPETGGIGTKIFYIAGGILVIGALLLMTVRRRKG